MQTQLRVQQHDRYARHISLPLENHCGKKFWDREPINQRFLQLMLDAAAYPIEPWLEHFEWLGPMFNEQLQLKDGRMWVPDRPGLGFSLSEQALMWTTEAQEFGQRPWAPESIDRRRVSAHQPVCKAGADAGADGVCSCCQEAVAH